MARFGAIGPTYTSQSLTADAERCVNLYLESIEAPQARSKSMLLCSPGLKAFSDVRTTEASITGLFTQNDRCFAAGSNFYEVFADGNKNQVGPLAASNVPVIMAGSQTQVLVCGAGKLWVFDLVAGTLTAVNMAQFNGKAVSTVAFSDGFFLALVAESQTIQISNLLDGLTWNGLNVGQVGVFPDNVISMLVDHRELWLWGRKASTVYYDTGAAFFPYSPIPGVYLETGSMATYCPAKLDNSVFWLHQDDRGQLIAYRASGYAPTRISNHSVEYLWSQYPKVDDVISYAFTDQGHAFWHLYFPTANAAWRYDAATLTWHEVGTWDGQKYLAHRSQCHTFAFGKHLVGDTQAGIIYDMSISYGDDNGTPIRRMRRTPTVSKENTWIRHNKIQADVETGITPASVILTGPSPANRGKGARSWVLADQVGVTWVVVLNDDPMGPRFQFQAQVGTPQQVYLSDTQIALRTYRVGIDSTIPGAPYVTLTVVPFRPGAPLMVPFVTQGGFQTIVHVDGGALTRNAPIKQRGPILSLRWSDDNAHTWSNYHDRDLGLSGQYKTLAIWRRLGRSRNRTYEFTYSDPIPLRLVEVDLDATPGFEPTERLVNQYSKGG